MNEFAPEPVPEGRSHQPARLRHRAARLVAIAGAAAAGVAGIAVLGSTALSANTVAAAPAPSPRPANGGVGLVSTAPNLPPGFRSTFRSRFVNANGIRQHAVIGGDGPPLLLVHGWPENWYAWRKVMPKLAEDYTVIAVDQRGIGRSQKTAGGYDAGTLADDLAALMTKLGHEHFAVVGHDTGAVVSYALAADHRERVERLAFAEIPGPPGVGDLEEPPAPPMFVPEQLNDKLWHIPFNRVDDDLILDMVSSNADAYYRYEYSIQGGGATLSDPTMNYYIKLYTRTRDVLRASFGLYRAWDDTLNQNRTVRQATKLTIPVLGIGGENSWGEFVGHGMEPTATDVTTTVLPGSGHWVAEQAPAKLLEVLTEFLAPYHAAAERHAD
jgi:pimeloyl-ACP methyl ester carboxylesterase